MKTRKALALVATITIAGLASIIGSFLATPSIPGWYKWLIKPEFTPPSWIFAHVMGLDDHAAQTLPILFLAG